MKNISVILITLILLLNLMSAADIIIKGSFDQGETLVAKTSGSFFEAVSEENVVFYRGHVRTSIVPNVEKINNDYYIYGQLADKAPGNYSIAIENARHFNGSKIESSRIEKNFTISENSAEFSIDRAAIATNKSFSIKLVNLKDIEIQVSIGTSEGTSDGINGEGDGGGFFATLFGNPGNSDSGPGSEISSATLKARESKKIEFEIETKNPLFYYITFNSENTGYEVPVYASPENTSEGDIELRLEPFELEIQMATNSESRGVFYIVNKGADVEDIFLIVSEEIEPYVSLPVSQIDSISENFSKKVEFDVVSDSEERVIEGNIAAIVGNDELQILIPITLEFVKDYIPVDGSGNAISKTCSQLNGKICPVNYTCSGSFEYARDGVCCLASCEAPKEKSPTGKIIGWLIIIVLVILVVWFYLKRYRKVESVSDLMRVLRR